ERRPGGAGGVAGSSDLSANMGGRDGPIHHRPDLVALHLLAPVVSAGGAGLQPPAGRTIRVAAVPRGRHRCARRRLRVGRAHLAWMDGKPRTEGGDDRRRLVDVRGHPRHEGKRSVRRARMDGGRAVRVSGLDQQPPDVAERFLPQHRCRVGVRPRRRGCGAREHPLHLGDRSGGRFVRLHAGVLRRRDPRTARPVGDSVAGGADQPAGHRRGGTQRMTHTMRIATAVLLGLLVARPTLAQETIPTFDELLAHKVALKPELVNVHPRVFVTKAEIDALRGRVHTTERTAWETVTRGLAAMKGAPPPVPGPQERRSQNDVAFAIAEVSLAYAVDRKPEYLAAAKTWTLAAIDYE